MINGNKIKSLTDAIDAVVDTNGGRLNGIKIAPDDNTLNAVVVSNVEVIIGNKALTNADRKLFMSAFIDAFDAVTGPRLGYDVLRASYSASGETGTVTIFYFVIRERI